MADVMLSTAAELAPRSKRPRGAQGWCTGPGVEAEMKAACQQREEARRHLRAEPHNSNLRKAVKMAGKNFGRCARLPCSSFVNSKHELKKATRPASTSTLRQ